VNGDAQRPQSESKGVTEETVSQEGPPSEANGIIKHIDSTEGKPMSLLIYLIGYAIFVAGLGLGAYYLHVPPRWIGVGVLVFVGLGVAGGVAKTRTKDPS
jgi:hypothetical protein